VSALEDALRFAAGELAARGARFALVGGLAVSVRTEPRFTRDVDLAVAVGTDREAEALVHALIERGWRVLAQVEQETRGRLATARLVPPATRVTEGVVVDLLFASSGIEREVVEAAQPLEVFEDLVLPVATVSHLLALKVLARSPLRPQDTADAIALVAVATPREVEASRAALERIRELGFDREKDLAAELEALLGR
jgi:hypothetical protein